MRIAIGSDAATELTEALADELKKRGHSLQRCGPVSRGEANRDWPLVAEEVARAVADGSADEGVVCCWTGTGVSIAANKIAGIRAALAGDAETARGARIYNHANVLALSLRATTVSVMKEILNAWFSTPIEGAEAQTEWNRQQVARVGALERLLTLALFFVLAIASAGCRNIGFREIDVSAKDRASVQMAHEVMTDIQRGLHAFYESRHRYPATTEAHLYDSIKNFVNPPMDPIHLYRNDNGKGYFIAVGSRSGRIVYRYPATIGTGDYSLYWVGSNGVDEEGEGDDVDAWQSVDTAKRFVRQRVADLENDRDPEHLLVIRTGPDLFRDSVRFEVVRRDSIYFVDTWPLSAYFRMRPELTLDERRHLIRSELDHFLAPAAFVHTDSLLQRDWSHWSDVKPNSPEMAELVASGELMFNYYAGDRGSRGIAWLKSKKKFVEVWKS